MKAKLTSSTISQSCIPKANPVVSIAKAYALFLSLFLFFSISGPSCKALLTEFLARLLDLDDLLQLIQAIVLRFSKERDVHPADGEPSSMMCL